MQLTPAIQEALVTLLLYDPAQAPLVSQIVKSKDFDLYYQELAEAASKYFGQYGAVPGEHALDLIENLKTRFPKNAEPYDRIFQSIEAARTGKNGTLTNSAFVMDQAKLFARSQRLKKGLFKAIEKLEVEDTSTLTEAEEILRKALDSSIELFDPGTFIHDSKRSLRFLENKEEKIFPTGIKRLDDRQLGPARGRLHLFLAETGFGKTWWLLHLAKQALLDRKRVLYISLEMDEEEVSQRIMQMLFSITKRQETVDLASFETDELGRFVDLRMHHLDDRPFLSDPKIGRYLTRKIKETLSHRPPLLVKQFPTGMLTFEELQGYLSALETSNRFIPDLLIIDYVDAMSIDSANLRIDTGVLYKKVRGLGVQRKIAVATASQTNRASWGKALVTKGAAAEDASKIHTCDVAITMNQTQAEFELGLARLFVAKGRGDKDKFTILISQAYPIGQFCMDEAGLVSSYWDAVKGESEDGDPPANHRPTLRSDEDSGAAPPRRKRSRPKS